MKRCVGLLILICATIGCTSSVPEVITIVPGASQLVVDQRFKVRLESAPGAGYLWDILQPFPTENVQLMINVVEQKVSKDMVGAPVDQVWTFKAIAPGKVRAVFGYHRPWEIAKPVRTSVYLLTIK